MRHTISALRAPWAPSVSCAGVLALFLSTLGGGGCAPASDDASPADDGSLRGELVVTISDDFDGRSETRFSLRDATGHERPLAFDVAPDLAPGSEVRVWGEPRATACT